MKSKALQKQQLAVHSGTVGGAHHFRFFLCLGSSLCKGFFLGHWSPPMFQNYASKSTTILTKIKQKLKMNE